MLTGDLVIGAPFPSALDPSALDPSALDLAALSAAAERRRVVAELHDLLGQQLTLLALECDLALAADHDGPSAPVLRQLRGRVDQLARSVAVLVDGVPPQSLRDNLDQAGQHLTMAGIQPRLAIDAELSEIDAATGAWLGCVLREGVTNVLRHAPLATRCEISLREGEDLVLTIRNDGAPAPAAVAAGSGIAGLRDRACPLGARIQITRRADSFELAARVPRRR
jgi:two-component system sensor histidine kinase DesK